MRFGDYLKQKREERGWTQPDAAAKAGIEQSYLSKLETGKSYPSEDVFGRLTEAYGIDMDSLLNTVSSRELTKLRDIAEIRSLLLERETRTRRASRGWLLAGLAMLMLGGGSLGLTTLGESQTVYAQSYVSWGVLQTNEPVHAFDIVHRKYDTDHPKYEEYTEMVSRIDPVRRIDVQNYGDFFIETVADGKRVFETYDSRPITYRSPLRWFFIPALTFLFGAVGCFFISFRWR